MNDKLERISNNQPIPTNNLEGLISSPNFMPAMNGLIEIFALCVDLSKSEERRKEAADNFAEAMQNLDLYEKTLDDELKTRQEYIDDMKKIVNMLFEKEKYEEAFRLNEAILSVINGKADQVIKLFNEHSTTGKIIQSETKE